MAGRILRERRTAARHHNTQLMRSIWYRCHKDTIRAPTRVRPNSEKNEILRTYQRSNIELVPFNTCINIRREYYNSISNDIFSVVRLTRSVKFIVGAFAHVIVLSLNVPFTEYASAAILALSKAPPHNFRVALLIAFQSIKNVIRSSQKINSRVNITYKIGRI